MKSEQTKPFLSKRWIILILFLLFIHFFPLPYYYSQPGDAKILSEVINVEGGHEEDGTFMLTTVQMGKANLLFYGWSYLSSYRLLYHEDQIRHEGESDEEYHHRQLMAMSSSQESAMIVAYEAAGKTIEYEYHGVIVTQLIEGMPAEEVLEIGDRILEVNGREIETAEQLIHTLSDKSVKDTVELLIKREDERIVVEVGFAPFPEKLGAQKGQVGIGISSPITERDIVVDPEVMIDTSQIGGPSAGLMFALEMYNQLTEENVTKGYHIAGTGTISEEGVVGRIGGAPQKVVAADRAGADYFLVPNDAGASQSNYEEALAAAEDIGAEMEIIPIDTFEEALEFLASIPPK
ncbi:SepM family pheromone-processing serine protease [Halalkalibacter hemicellulosilyticus]|uniref:endopeptidase La n=1 Tax=Halalkalibacter hemicellulosilyticusJCM 9152 TaxID=1236971 RepID=W4QBS2_9BACI|nr:SepM family pheromone-processing serine protease [Halalkalibacter hemicellulosilyticus]GAE29133.1 Lon-like protease with PDZ domain [Halalkalibacter hemicellulosilyticusJCM 9152]